MIFSAVGVIGCGYFGPQLVLRFVHYKKYIKFWYVTVCVYKLYKCTATSNSAEETGLHCSYALKVKYIFLIAAISSP